MGMSYSLVNISSAAGKENDAALMLLFPLAFSQASLLSCFGGTAPPWETYSYVMLCTQESAMEAVIHKCQAFMHKPVYATNVRMLHQVS
jgi:hypothetical protein